MTERLSRLSNIASFGGHVCCVVCAYASASRSHPRVRSSSSRLRVSCLLFLSLCSPLERADSPWLSGESLVSFLFRWVFADLPLPGCTIMVPHRCYLPLKLQLDPISPPPPKPSPSSPTAGESSPDFEPRWCLLCFEFMTFSPSPFSLISPLFSPPPPCPLLFPYLSPALFPFSLFPIFLSVCLSSVFLLRMGLPV